MRVTEPIIRTRLLRPLEGFRVIDLTHALAGPVCTYQLALLGADVIKIENPGVGDDFRGFAKDAFNAVNSGKRSVTLDFKKPGALDVLARLARDADVLVDNFKPGTAEKFGITPASVQSWNEKLIWCSISGFGLEGPWRDMPAVEWSVQAASGLSDSYLGDGDDPHHLGFGMLDISTGHAAATAVLAALLKRSRTGTGERIDVAMLDVALNLMTTRIATTGPTRMGKRPAVGRFMAQDQQIFIMGAHQRWFEAISATLGEPLLSLDPRFATQKDREANIEQLKAALEERLAARTAQEWETQLSRAGVPAAAVRRLPEVVTAEHVQMRQSLYPARLANSADAPLVCGLPYQFSDGPYTTSATPALGEHTDSVLESAGYTPAEVASLKDAGIV